MRLHRFYTTEKIESQDEVCITEERIVHQVQKVLRLNIHDRIVVFDGGGKDYEAEIVDSDKKSLKIKILESKKVFVPEKKITLFMSVIKKENFELVCEKATELGVTKIVPVVTERTLQKNLNRERVEKILVEASEQCGRGNLPILGDQMTLIEVIENYSDVFVCDLSEGNNQLSSTKLQTTTHNQIGILIGPEGGWTEKEREMFKEKSMMTVSLGETVLRAETAGIVGVSFLMN